MLAMERKRLGGRPSRGDRDGWREQDGDSDWRPSFLLWGPSGGRGRLAVDGHLVCCPSFSLRRPVEDLAAQCGLLWAGIIARKHSAINLAAGEGKDGLSSPLVPP